MHLSNDSIDEMHFFPADLSLWIHTVFLFCIFSSRTILDICMYCQKFFLIEYHDVFRSASHMTTSRSYSRPTSKLLAIWHFAFRKKIHLSPLFLLCLFLRRLNFCIRICFLYFQKDTTLFHSCIFKFFNADLQYEFIWTFIYITINIIISIP